MQKGNAAAGGDAARSLPRPRSAGFAPDTLARLTRIPSHKQKLSNRHFPALAMPDRGEALVALSQAAVENRGSTTPSSSGQGSRKPSMVGSSRGSPSRTPNDAMRRESAADSEKRIKARRASMQLANLRRVFRYIDRDGDGAIDYIDVYHAQRKVGGHLGREECHDMLWEVDDDLDGGLSLGDFLTSYFRSQKDESGYDPKRLYAVVEFLLIDKDLSGEITVDEAMSSIFEHRGADDLARATQIFFSKDDGEGAGEGTHATEDRTLEDGSKVINFTDFYKKVGLRRPVVPSTVDLRRTYSQTAYYAGDDAKAKPKLARAASVPTFAYKPKSFQPPTRRFKPTKRVWLGSSSTGSLRTKPADGSPNKPHQRYKATQPPRPILAAGDPDGTLASSALSKSATGTAAARKLNQTRRIYPMDFMSPAPAKVVPSWSPVRTSDSNGNAESPGAEYGE